MIIECGTSAFVKPKPMKDFFFYPMKEMVNLTLQQFSSIHFRM